MEERRSDQDGGLSGWVARARRHSGISSGQDETTLQRQKFFWNVLVDYWFRMEIDGWENIPGSPALLVGHSLGCPVRLGRLDRRSAMVAALRPGPPVARHRARRVDGDPGHRAVLPVDGRASGRPGLRSPRRWPRGATSRYGPAGKWTRCVPWTERDRANLAGRKGFVKMAIRAGVPIVPIATVGGADAMPVLIRGDRLSKVLQLDRLLRLKVFPLAVSLPWGIAPAALPQLPLPAKIRTRFMPASSSTTIPRAPRTTTTSTASTARSKTASSREWTRWRASVRCRCSLDERTCLKTIVCGASAVGAVEVRIRRRVGDDPLRAAVASPPCSRHRGRCRSSIRVRFPAWRAVVARERRRCGRDRCSHSPTPRASAGFG